MFWKCFKYLNASCCTLRTTLRLKFTVEWLAESISVSKLRSPQKYIYNNASVKHFSNDTSRLLEKWVGERLFSENRKFSLFCSKWPRFPRYTIVWHHATNTCAFSVKHVRKHFDRSNFLIRIDSTRNFNWIYTLRLRLHPQKPIDWIIT